MDQTPLSAPSP
nr:unnamed protein product [Callosobruchus chinensis]